MKGPSAPPAASSPQYFLTKGAASLVVRAVGLAIGFVSHVLFARWLGPSQYGFYAIALSWALVLAVPVRFGLDVSALRFATVYLEERRVGELRGLVAFSISVMAVVATALACLLAIAKVVDLGILRNVSSQMILWIVGLIFSLSALSWFSVLLRTMQRIIQSQLFEQVVRPALAIVGIMLCSALSGPATAEMAMLLTFAAATGALMAIGSVIAPLLRNMGSGRMQFGDRRHWITASWVLLFITIAQEVLVQVEIILLGALVGSGAAGEFAAASRISGLTAMGLAAIVMISGPLIASAWQRQDVQELARIARLTARLSFLFGLVAGLMLAVVGPFALNAFGPGFDDAYQPLLILLVGTIVNASTGAVAYLLTMTGRERTALVIFSGSLAVSLMLNLLLIPPLGVIGAAISSASAVAFWNLMMLVAVRRTLGVDASVVGRATRPTNAHGHAKLASQEAGEP